MAGSELVEFQAGGWGTCQQSYMGLRPGGREMLGPVAMCPVGSRPCLSLLGPPSRRRLCLWVGGGDMRMSGHPWEDSGLRRCRGPLKMRSTFPEPLGALSSLRVPRASIGHSQSHPCDKGRSREAGEEVPAGREAG